MAYVVGEYQGEGWEEPCMSCFKQIHYTNDDISKKIKQHNEIPNDVMYEYNYILCPNCGKEMEVHRVDVMLC